MLKRDNREAAKEVVTSRYHGVTAAVCSRGADQEAGTGQ